MHECYYVHDNFLHNSRYVILDRKGTNTPSIPISYLTYSFLCQNETNNKRGVSYYWLRSWMEKLDKYKEMRFDGKRVHCLHGIDLLYVYIKQCLWNLTYVIDFNGMKKYQIVTYSMIYENLFSWYF